MIRVFIGFDAREAVAYSVLSHSILARASIPVAIAPLMLSQLGDVFKRERNPLQSTDFAFSRFLVPYLSGYEGWSLFMDCDMLMTANGLPEEELVQRDVVQQRQVPAADPRSGQHGDGITSAPL